MMEAKDKGDFDDEPADATEPEDEGDYKGKDALRKSKDDADLRLKEALRKGKTDDLKGGKKGDVQADDDFAGGGEEDDETRQKDKNSW